MKRLLLAIVILYGSVAAAQLTNVTAQVKDANGSLYVNCSFSVVFVGQNTTPGVGPYQPAAYLNGIQGNCDSSGYLGGSPSGIQLADNINTITPTPSQWSFSICSASGYLGGPYCKSNILITITGASQDISANLTAVLPLLPPSSGTGGTNVLGTNNQISVAQNTPVAGTATLSIPNNPIFPGNVTTTGNLTVSGSQIVAFARTINAISGSSSTLAAAGTINNTGVACFLGGNITDQGCPTVGGTPGGLPTQMQFNNSGTFGGSSCTWSTSTNTMTCPNIQVLQPFFITSSFASSSCGPSAVGTSTLGVDVTGQWSISNNGGPCTAIPLGAGGSIVPNPIVTQSVTQPASTNFYVNTINGANVVTPSWNWSLIPQGSPGLTGGTSATVTLNCSPSSPCPLGLDTTNGAYQLVTDGAINSGSATLTSASSKFTPLMTGSFISVSGAGSGGTTLYTTIQAVSGCNAGSTACSTVTLNATNLSGGNVTGATVNIGTYLYRVYISGGTGGAAEATTVLTGNCTSGGVSSCQITFIPANPHSGSYNIGSASSGLQEAINDAWTTDSVEQNYPDVREIGGVTYNIYSTVYLRGRGGNFFGYGALNACYTRDRCFYLGITKAYPSTHGHKVYGLAGYAVTNVDGLQVSNISATSGVYTIATVQNPTSTYNVGDTVLCTYSSQNAQQSILLPITATSSSGITLSFGSATFGTSTNAFGWCALENTFIENNSADVTLSDTQFLNTSHTFTYGIVNDNDQNFTINSPTTLGGSTFRVTANWPNGAMIYQREDFGMAGIVNLNAPDCTNVNCFDSGWQANGNGLRINGGTMQGFNEFGVRYFGGLQSINSEGVYQEGACVVNPLLASNACGNAGFIVGSTQGSTIKSAFPIGGAFTQYVCSSGGSCAAGTQYNVYIVPNSSVSGYGPIMFAGYTNPNSSAVGNVENIQWFEPGLSGVGTLTFDIIATTGNSPTAAPWASTASTIATNVPASNCTNGVCSYSWTIPGSLSAYTVQTQHYVPFIWMFGGIIANNGIGPVYLDQIGYYMGSVFSYGATGVGFIADRCSSSGTAYTYSPSWVSCPAADGSGGSNSTATVFQQLDHAGGGPTQYSKGRLNFGSGTSTLMDLLTLQDSKFSLTTATPGMRPNGNSTAANTSGDAAICQDGLNQICERAATAWSWYLNSNPDNSSYKMRLNSSGLTVGTSFIVGGSNTSTFGGSATFNGTTLTNNGATQLNSTVTIGASAALLGSGIVDGKAPITTTNTAACNLGTASGCSATAYNSGYTFNQNATAGTAVTYTLPATSAGLQYCVRNSIVSGTGAADTGVLTVYPPSGSYVILNGVRNTVGGGGTHGVASGGAAGDSACFVAIDANDWEVYVQRGTWTAN